MSKSSVHGVMAGLVLLAYLLSGLFAQAFAGVIDGETFGVALACILVGSAIVFGVASALIRMFSGKTSEALNRRSRVTPRALKTLSAAMLGAAGLGIWLSMDPVGKHSHDAVRHAAAASSAVTPRATEAAATAESPAPPAVFTSVETEIYIQTRCKTFEVLDYTKACLRVRGKPGLVVMDIVWPAGDQPPEGVTENEVAANICPKYAQRFVNDRREFLSGWKLVVSVFNGGGHAQCNF